MVLEAREVLPTRHTCRNGVAFAKEYL